MDSDKTKKINRRAFLKGAASTAIVGTAAVTTGCKGKGLLGSSEVFALEFQEYFKKHYCLMTPAERQETVSRLEKLARIKQDITIEIDTTGPGQDVLYGYAFNVTRCEGYMECVKACVKENNLDRRSNTQYIRIFEMEHGQMSPDQGDGKYFHMVPREGHFYMGVQCFQCENPPCVKACPTKATWKEPDGIVVVDYDWCIGCRYCMAACPYWGRRFNWNQPEIPKQEIATQQHYLGNRQRVRGMMEKCTFCIQRSRKGKLTACVEACPTGARVFGNLLDPDSEIRFVLENKKVYRLKEDLGTDPKFWYFID
ncbi:MAG: 4Fe-4S dicluster domain-containing protein [Proteobacteria bacterium]|nr:4Fe-4S dicluster domain-containing protein [Pseudomonadota bacterium]MBU1586138.1 4Fe-4S dicluster domain-containing protein [Pseudomonadota bacterium]MBU2631076.1 4Fe-4S dicluster domain-containing protein [Pseudomonadota bacterium]